MSEELIGIIALTAGIFVGTLYNKYLQKYGTRKERFVAIAKENYCSANGIVINAKVSGGKDSGLHIKHETAVVKYQYVANGNMYYKKLRFSSPKNVYYPDRMTIYYDKYNPKKCIAEKEMSKSIIMRNKAFKTLTLTMFTIAAIAHVFKILF